MGKKRNTVLSIPSKQIDPALDALFSTSSAPIQGPLKSRHLGSNFSKPRDKLHSEFDDCRDDEEISSGKSSDTPEARLAHGSGESARDYGLRASPDTGSSGDDERDIAAQILSESKAHERKQRKKRKQDKFDDIEGKYFDKLGDDEPLASKRRRSDEDATEKEAGEDGEDGSDGDIPVHESLAQNKEVEELEKASRTVFLSNVSIEAASSKKAKNALKAHLSSFLDKAASPAQSLESLRFRSLPFSTAAMPKRAAFVTKSLMGATTQSINAYVVYSSAAVARAACEKLNGTVVLDRHLRVDSVAHPAAVDHRRCVFIGNLGFVDDETVLNMKSDEEGKERIEKRKRTKVPMDVEEGLWRTFGQQAGKVESVRVVRDQTTRVGKGIAYVQFYDGNSVESALLLNGKKFPPMLPRELRVSRCKAPHKTARAMEKKNKEIRAFAASAKAKSGTRYVRKLTAEEQTMVGRARKLFGHSAAQARIAKTGWKRRNKIHGGDKTFGKEDKEGVAPTAIKRPEDFIFEGRRASSRDAKPRDLKQKIRKRHAVAKPKKKKSAR